MCLIAFAIGASDKWPLVVASNRDEFLDRPTLPLARWTTSAGKEVISGRDERAGGTWLGLSPGGRVAMLTNVREPQPSNAEKSRGELVMQWLEGESDLASFMTKTDGAAYGPCNLVLGRLGSATWHWLTNRGESAGWSSQVLAPGTYGLSNGALDAPWPKTLALRQALQTVLAVDSQEELEDGLWAALMNGRRAEIDDLPDTGVPLALEHALSSAFVEFPEHGYGTRCSTLVVVERLENATGSVTHPVSVKERSHTRSAAGIQFLQTNVGLGWPYPT
ncbi:MAG TPA: NRDE family protein [Polaromonas sp.]|uniref:NRDE family protein n=1 Tax=Polaromonas sp. TaxID=1869339 RepID=UPI002D5DC71A|nr:NRDE family protein [Polaromonas sp.]HYW57301.1 NRDE family protein [Polaromonas sp.]